MSKGMASVKIAYGVLLGILLAMLVGFGVAGFYKGSDYYGEGHARNAFLMAFVCSMAFSIVGLLLPRRVDVFRLGLLVGGLITLLFAVIYPSTGGLSMWWFFGGVIIALVVLVPIGYLKLMRDRDDGGFEQD